MRRLFWVLNLFPEKLQFFTMRLPGPIREKLRSTVSAGSTKPGYQTRHPRTNSDITAMTYVITYTLHRPGQDYNNLYKAIEGISGIHWHPTTSVWIVESLLTAKQIFERIFPHTLDTNDELMVLRLQGEGHTKINDAHNLNWLRQRQY